MRCSSIVVIIITALLFPLNAGVLSQEQGFESVLQFESTGEDGVLSGWGGGPMETIHYDSIIVYSGKGAARLERDTSSSGPFSTIAYYLPIDFDGEWIELRGFLRTEEVSGFAGLWMREDSRSGSVQFDNMQNRGIKGTTDWTEYIVRLPADVRAIELIFGVLVVGEGKVWADNLELLVDGKPIMEAPKRIIEPSILDTDQEFSAGSNITLSSLTETQIEHLTIMGMVWGFLKYHHPRITTGDLHWDFELFRVLPSVLNASELNGLHRILTQWVDELGVPESCDPCAQLPEDAHLLPEIDWIRDTELLGPRLSSQLQSVYTNRFSGEEQFYVSQGRNVGNPVFDRELSYESQQLPDAGFRILALFRLWNIIEYWFPYRNQLDDNWQSVLRDFLPRFVEVNSWDDYKLELLSFIAHIRDTHANLWSALDVRPPCGNCFWPVEVRFIEGKATITAFTDSINGPMTGLEIGDIIETIDDQSIESLVEEWSPYYCASNLTTRLRDIARFLPRGECGESKLTINRRGQSQTLMVARIADSDSRLIQHDRPGETFQLLSPEVAYIKLSSIRVQDVVSYIEQASSTRGLVIDIRNYPSEFVVFALGSRLVEQPTPFARFTIGDPDNPGAFTWTAPLVLQPETPGYKGKIAVLVNEMTMSSAEYTAMALRAGPRAVVVGSTTAGADGNVSRIPLPGGLQTMISGIGVFYPDKTPTQRIGIVPDIVAKPTIDGIRLGRDEVLEAALLHILGTDADQDMIRRIAARQQ